MSLSMSGGLFRQTATHQPRIKAEQSKKGWFSSSTHIKGNLPEAIENLGDLITVNTDANPSTVTIDQDKFREALTSATTTLANCIDQTPTPPNINAKENLSHSLSEIGRFLGQHYKKIETSTDKTTIAVCLKQLEDITSAIGLIEAFSKDNNGKGTQVKLDDASNTYLQGFNGHWDRQDIKVNSWNGQIKRVGNKQDKATTGLQAWGKYFADFRALHTADRANDASRKRTLGDSAKHLIGKSQWNPFQETQITSQKLKSHHTKSIGSLEGPKKAQQCLSNAQNAMNHRDFTNANEFLQQGIEALSSNNLIAENPKLLAKLMVEQVLAKNPNNPTILEEYKTNDENIPGSFIKNVDIQSIPEINIGQIKNNLLTALASRQKSLNKAAELKLLKKNNMGGTGPAGDTTWWKPNTWDWITTRYMNLGTDKSSVNLTEPKPDIAPVAATDPVAATAPVAAPAKAPNAATESVPVAGAKEATAAGEKKAPVTEPATGAAPDPATVAAADPATAPNAAPDAAAATATVAAPVAATGTEPATESVPVAGAKEATAAGEKKAPVTEPATAPGAATDAAPAAAAATAPSSGRWAQRVQRYLVRLSKQAINRASKTREVLVRLSKRTINPNGGNGAAPAAATDPAPAPATGAATEPAPAADPAADQFANTPSGSTNIPKEVIDSIISLIPSYDTSDYNDIKNTLDELPALNSWYASYGNSEELIRLKSLKQILEKEINKKRGTTTVKCDPYEGYYKEASTLPRKFKNLANKFYIDIHADVYTD